MNKRKHNTNLYAYSHSRPNPKMMNLYFLFMLASFFKFFPSLWENYQETLFLWFSRYCSEYLSSVEMPRLVQQYNCPYLSLAERLRYIPEDRRFDRWIITKCIQLFRRDLNIKPRVIETTDMPWENIANSG